MARAPSMNRQRVLSTCVEEGGTPAEAAQRHGVSLQSVQRREARQESAASAPSSSSSRAPVKQNKRLRAASRLAGQEREALVAELLEDTLRLHVEAVASLASSEADPLMRVELLAKLSQALDRTLRALGKASPELSRLAVAKEVLERMALFVQEHFPRHLTVFVEILEPFAAALVAEEGRG